LPRCLLRVFYEYIGTSRHYEERVGSESRQSVRVAARSAAVEPRQTAMIAAQSVAIDSSSPWCSSRRVPCATSHLNVGSHPQQSVRIAAR